MTVPRHRSHSARPARPARGLLLLAALVALAVGPLEAQTATADATTLASRQSGEVVVSDQEIDVKVGPGFILDAALSRQTAGGSYSLSFGDSIPSYVGSCTAYDGSLVCTTPGIYHLDAAGSAAADEFTLFTSPGPEGVPFVFPTTVRLRTGAGADRVATRNLVATINTGRGDDVIAVDAIDAVYSTPPPGVVLTTPGDDVQGDNGVDTVTYQAVTYADLRVSLDDEADDGRPGEKDNIHSDVENLIGPRAGFTAIGSPAANILIGQRGRDHLVGGAGRDKLKGRGGNDLLDARDDRGRDLISCGDGRDVVRLDRGDRILDRSACEKVIHPPRDQAS